MRASRRAGFSSTRIPPVGAFSPMRRSPKTCAVSASEVGSDAASVTTWTSMPRSSMNVLACHVSVSEKCESVCAESATGPG